jgi:hypothetical protein
MAEITQPYHLDYRGNPVELARIFANADEMFHQLYEAASDAGGDLTFVAGTGITITVSGTTVTITNSNTGVTMPQVAARVALGV